MDVQMVNIIHERIHSCFTFIVYNIFRKLVMNRDNDDVRVYLKELWTVVISTTVSSNVFIGISGYFMGNNDKELKFLFAKSIADNLSVSFHFGFSFIFLLFRQYVRLIAPNQSHFGVQMRNEKHHITANGYRRFWVFIANKICKRRIMKGKTEQTKHGCWYRSRCRYG